MRFGSAVGQEVCRKKLAGKRRGARWERLPGGRMLSRDSACGIFVNLDREKRGAIDAIEEIDKTLF